MPTGWIFTLYIVERFCEVVLAKRNQRLLEGRGGREFYPESYRAIVFMHTLFWLALMAESWPWKVPLDLLTLCGLTILVLLMGLRYWCIASLGPYWNTRIIVVPGAERVCRGPYRWLRHPNYLVVTLEFLFLPLLLRAPFTLLIFSLANLLLLRHRILLEERALELTETGDLTSPESDGLP